MGNKLGKKVKSGWNQTFRAIPCTSWCKRRKRSLPTVDITEKSADPSSSSPITRTSTTVSPPRSPPIPSSPSVTDIPHISTADGHNLIGFTLVAPSPQQSSPWAKRATDQSQAPQLSTSSKVDSGPDNLDKIFDEAWKPGNGLKLADGSDLPWAKGTSSPSAAAKYLDDIEDGP